MIEAGREHKTRYRARAPSASENLSYTYDRIAADDGCNRIGTRIAYAAYRTPDDKLLFGYQYTYDTAGNISGVTTIPSERDNITQAYTYDALGQLTTETTGASTRTYAYDTAGNIRSIFMYIGRRCSSFFLKPAKMT